MAELNHIEWFRLSLLARFNPMSYKQGTCYRGYILGMTATWRGKKGAKSAVIHNVWPQDSDLLTGLGQLLNVQKLSQKRERLK